MSKNIFTVPCVNSQANRNFQKTILDGVKSEKIPDSFHEKYDLTKEKYPVWGTSVVSSWKKANKDDLALFYPESGQFTSAAKIVGKGKDSDFGKSLWANYEKGPFDYILIFDGLIEIDLSLAEFNELFDYSKSNVPQGFGRIAENRVERVLGEYQSMDKLIQNLKTDNMSIDITAKQEVKDEKRSNIPIGELINKFMDYLKFNGFYFEEDEIKNFVLSLKTKPFVILAGISGTGKTKLASLFADFIDAEKRLISVKPNWTDNSDLLGYQDISGEFRKQTMTELLISANKEENRNKPHFAILDEMNLARVEHYFSDFLSKMETKKLRNNRLQSDAIFDEEYVEGINDGKELSDLRITDNFYVVGTVNMDETTHPFSRKVLDRANSLEFTEVHLDKIDMQGSDVSERSLKNSVISPDYLKLSQLYDNDPELFDEIVENLEEINNILREGDFQVGYRVRDEVCIYVYYAVTEDILTRAEAFDFQLKQKILPRLQGSTETISSVLKNLYLLCVREEGTFPGDWNNNKDIKQRLSNFNKGKYLYPRSAKKIMRMQRRYLEQTFTSFWI